MFALKTLKDPRQLSKLLAEIISVELSKPDEDIDTGLIDECQSLINILLNAHEYTEKEIETHYNRILLKTKAAENPFKQPNKAFFSLKKVLVASVVIFIFFGFSIGLLAIKPTLQEIFSSSDSIIGEIGDCTWELPGKTLIIRGNGSTGAVPNPPWGTEIKRLIVTEGVTHLGDHMFRFCYDLAEVSLPSTLKGIGVKTFEHCYSIKTITLPEGLEIIDVSAFQQCDGLIEVYIPNSVKTIGYMAFMNCRSLRRITVGENNMYYSDIDGVLYNKEQTVLICYPTSRNGESYEIPYGVSEICDYAFFGASEIKEFIVPQTIKKLGESAFEFTWYKDNAKFEDGVLYIGPLAIAARKSTTELKIKDGTTVIADACFYEMPNLKTAIIPEGVVNLGNFNFELVPNLTRIYLPTSLLYMDESSFRVSSPSCVVVYAGSHTDRLKIEGKSSYISWVPWEYEIGHDGNDHASSLDIKITGAACNGIGYEEAVCTVCNVKILTIIPIRGHSWTDWTRTKQATCSEKGQFTRTCIYCGIQETHNTSMIPHAMGSWTQIKEPTFTEEGIMMRKCKNCSYTETSTVEPLGNPMEESE